MTRAGKRILKRVGLIRPSYRSILKQIRISPINDEVEQVRRKIEAAAIDNRPIVLGPWLSEVGYELLYWIPFLRSIGDNYPLNTENVYAISRGGVEDWYKGIAGTYIEIFESYDESQYKEKNRLRIEETGIQKQIRLTSFDSEILTRFESITGIDDYNLLHPSLMYKYIDEVIHNKIPFKTFLENLSFDILEAETDPKAIENLPEDYIAVKFYFSECFPMTAKNVDLMKDLIRRLSKDNNVVNLNQGYNIDDHLTHEFTSENNIYTIKDKFPLHNNLGIQTSILAGAKAFYGTYGGFSYLAPFLGVPSVSFYSSKEMFWGMHADVARLAFRNLRRDARMGGGRGRHSKFTILYADKMSTVPIQGRSFYDH